MIRLAALLLLAASLAQAGPVETDLAYGPLPHQRLDIYRPDTVTPDAPAIVFFYGGAWRWGDKESLARFGRDFADAGMIFVAPDYRLAPDAVFPGFVEDSALATAFAAQALGARPLFLGGWSAGAYNALRVAFDQQLLADSGLPEGAITGAFGLAGPYDGGMCAGARCPDIFPDDTRPGWPAASFADADDPPILLIAGDMDEYVPIRHLETLAKAAEAAGVSAETLQLPTYYHKRLLSKMTDEGSPVRQAVFDFIARHSAQ